MFGGQSRSSSIRSTIVERLSKATLVVDTLIPTAREELANSENRKTEKGEEESLYPQLSRLEIESLPDDEVQNQRIAWILKNLANKLKLIAALSWLLENNGERLEIFFGKSETYNFVKSVCERYGTCVQEISGTSGAIHGEVVCDPLLLKAIDMMSSNQNLCDKVNELEKTQPLEMDNIVIQIRALQQVTEALLSVSAKEEQEKENELRRAFNQSDDLRQQVCVLVNHLHLMRAELSEQIWEKSTVYQSYADKIKTSNKNFNFDLKQFLFMSEKAAQESFFQSRATQEKLQEDLDHTTHHFNSLLDRHLSNERSLKLKTKRVEKQLHSLVSKYDAELMSKKDEFEEELEIFEEDGEKLEQAKRDLKVQERRYKFLMKEKADVEHETFRKKMYHFIATRSAKAIQRTWREYMERKKAKKRARLERARKRREAAKKKAHHKGEEED